MFTQQQDNTFYQPPKMNMSKPTFFYKYNNETYAEQNSMKTDSPFFTVNQGSFDNSKRILNTMDMNNSAFNNNYSNNYSNNSNNNNYSNNNFSYNNSNGGNNTNNTASRPNSAQRKTPKGSVTAADRAIRFGGSSKTTLYNKLKLERVKERKEAIKNNLMDGPNTKRRLEDAIIFRGTCETKCPTFEILEREIQNGLDSFELNERGEVDPDKVVKAYRRSAAGNEQPLPSDVRTPEALLATLDYLFHEILPNYPLEQCHAFLRDRTRSIRQDFTLQNIRDTTAVIAHEQIARFHILCLHEMCEMDDSKFSAQQETEQLRKVLLSLVEFYDDLREEDIQTPNEAEFRAYFMLINIRDSDITRQAMTLPIHVFRHPYMDKALLFHGIVQSGLEIEESATRKNKVKNSLLNQNWFTRLFKMVAMPDTPFLISCLLEYHFPEIRKNALKALNRCFSTIVGGASVEELKTMLGYDSISQILSDAKSYGLQLDMSLGIPSISFSQKHNITKAFVFREPISNPSPTKSLTLVEPKKNNRSLEDIVCNVEELKIPQVPNKYQNTSTIYTPMISSRPTHPSTRRTAPLPPFIQATPNIAAPTPSHPSPTAPPNASNPFMTKRKNEIDNEKNARIKTALDLKKNLQMAEASISEERKRLEKMIDNKQKKKEEEHQKRQQREIEMMRKKDEEARLLRMELERKKKQQEMEKLMEQVASKMKAVKRNRTIHLIKSRLLPRLDVARCRIKKRECTLRKSSPMKRLLNVLSNKTYAAFNCKELLTLYRHGVIDQKERVKLAYEREEEAIYILSQEFWDTQSTQRLESKPLEDIYPHIKDKMIQRLPADYKPTWELSVVVADETLASSQWYRHYLKLEQPFSRKIHRFQHCDIKAKMYTPDTIVSSKSCEEIGGILFSLPETEFHNELEWNAYWEIHCHRLEEFISKIYSFNVNASIPLVISFFPGSNISEEMISEIPRLLRLLSNEAIKDYHILLMNGPTLAIRTHQEIEWMASIM
ncbi:SAC3/GANP/Nin1/mts3/eIF-3 p25 family-domain-containing protein [Pilobolus umbonatus]|nr:SAC3/GANP/Nin1/mts3/eIF-3 p25 family-domain-containing protein [Pilobolus umbonatus]